MFILSECNNFLFMCFDKKTERLKKDKEWNLLIDGKNNIKSRKIIATGIVINR